MIDVQTALIRMALAILAGALIGIERQWRHKNAGIKTNTLVCLGAAGFAIISNTFGPTNHNPAQIAAAVVTGIGFIGAGVIIHRGATVQGVTTAATLWVNAAMGLAIGLGQLMVAAAVFVGIVIVQFVMRRVELWLSRMKHEGAVSRIELLVECEPASFTAINGAFTQFVTDQKLTVLRRSSTRALHSWTWRAALVSLRREPLDLTPLEEQLVNVKGVTHVEAKFVGFEDEPSIGL